MAFDATIGGASANSYITIADAVAYLTDVANVTAFSVAAQGDQESALIRATRYLENRYIELWPGLIANEDQALSWPRKTARDREGRKVPDNAIPAPLVAATAELAVIALTDANLFTHSSRTEGGVRREKVKVGPIEQEIEYSGSLSVTEIHRRADEVLRTLLARRGRLRRT